MSGHSRCDSCMDGWAREGPVNTSYYFQLQLPSILLDHARSEVIVNTLHSPTSPGGLLVHSWSIPESWWTPGSFLKFLRSPSPFLPHSCPIPASFLICVNMGMRKCATSKYGNLL